MSSTPAQPRRALLLLGQSPFDPASGAARSMQTMARWLARAGWAVQSLSTNASESHRWAAGLTPDLLAAHGLVDTPPAHAQGGERSAVALGVDWHWLPTTRQHDWESEIGARYDACLERLLREGAPDVVLTFGDDPGDRRRRRACRRTGARVVFTLHNPAYVGRDLPDVDRLLAPSAFLADAYRHAGHQVDVLPMPIEADDLHCEDHEPLCVVFANPEPLKGLMLVARIAERLVRVRPDIPLLVAGGRGSTQDFTGALARLGVAPDAAPNVLLAPDGLPPRELFRLVRLCLMPSLVAESGGRMAAEAQCVGAVPLVSSLGALPETIGAGGLVLPVPDALIRAPLTMPSVDDAAPWLAAIESLVDEADRFQQLRSQAQLNSQRFTAPQGIPALEQWMIALLASRAGG